MCIGQYIAIMASSGLNPVITRLHPQSYDPNRALAAYSSHQPLSPMHQHLQHHAPYPLNEPTTSQQPHQFTVNIVNAPTVTSTAKSNLENEENIINNKSIIPNYAIPSSPYTIFDTITNWITTHKSLICTSGLVLYIVYHYNTIRKFKNYLKKSYRWSGWKRTINNHELYNSENRLQLTQDLLYDIQLRYVNTDDLTNPIKPIQLFLNDLIEEEKLINKSIYAYKKLDQIKLTRILFLSSSLRKIAEQCKTRIILLRELVCRLIAAHNHQSFMSSLDAYY